MSGVDLANLTDAEFEAIHEAFLRHHVLAIRGQDITPSVQLEFSQRWGELSIHPYIPSIDGYPGIMEISGPTPVTMIWHSDTTHNPRPPSITMLVARTIPPYGNDTLFSNQHAAYEGLSDGFRSVLDGLSAVHAGTALAYDAGLDEITHAVHPVVITHPETGRKALYVNADYTRHFDGWTDDESKPLLDYLYALAARPEYTYRHRWADGDVVLWDNRSVQHAVVGDVHEHRVMHRVTLTGGAPV